MSRARQRHQHQGNQGNGAFAGRGLHAELQRHHREFRHDFRYVHKHLDKLWEHVAETNERLHNLEAQMNLLSRLLTTLCIEKFGMKLSTFRRLIRRIEKEAIADSEIHHLQDLYQLESSHKDKH